MPDTNLSLTCNNLLLVIAQDCSRTVLISASDEISPKIETCQAVKGFYVHCSSTTNAAMDNM
jgi:hypothetical protein